MKMAYRGETSSKCVARQLTWWQHALRLTRFKKLPHVFLASRVAGDVETLRSMGVNPALIWAVENDYEQYRHLFDRRRIEGWHLYTKGIEPFMESRSGEYPSVNLDLCGNLQGCRKTIRRVVAQLPENSVVSITLFLGREQEQSLWENREANLIRLVKASTLHTATLVQTVQYVSSDGETKGSPMQIWTFYLGSSPGRSVMRFDLTSAETLSSLAGSSEAVRKLWSQARAKSKSRSQAAVKANKSRKAA